MVITESELREWWRNGKGSLPAFPAGTRFSPSAQDLIKDHNLEIRFEDETLQTPNSKLQTSRPAAPSDEETGAPERGARLRLRGKLDSLHAFAMLAAAEARRYQLPPLAEGLDTVAAYCREIQSAEYQARPVQPLALAGKSEEEIQDISHRPERHLGLAHVMPGAEDHAILHWLNTLRTMARETEIVAREAFPAPERADRSALPAAAGQSLARALNRLSNGIYYLELLFNSGALGWKNTQ